MNIIHTAQGRFGQELKEMQIKKKQNRTVGKEKISHSTTCPVFPHYLAKSFLPSFICSLKTYLLSALLQLIKIRQ